MIFNMKPRLASPVKLQRGRRGLASSATRIAYIIQRPSKKYKPHGAYYPQLPPVLLSRVTALIILCSSGDSGFYVAEKYVSSIKSNYFCPDSINY